MCCTVSVPSRILHLCSSVRHRFLDRTPYGWHSIEFLVHRGRVVGDRLLVIWDGSPIHRRAEVQEFLAEAGGKIHLEPLPP